MSNKLSEIFLNKKVDELKASFKHEALGVEDVKKYADIYLLENALKWDSTLSHVKEHCKTRLIEIAQKEGIADYKI